MLSHVNMSSEKSNGNFALEVIMYLVNSVLAFLMIFFTFVNPSLLKYQYWTYILVALVTAIIFHTGSKVGKNNG